MSAIKFTIDGKEITATAGQTILQAAHAAGVYIPYLCHAKDIVSPGTCRICTVKVNGRSMAACHTPAADGLVVENETPELQNMRKAILELLFVEGNHFCPSCEKSGNCELQAMAYRYQMFSPRFEYEFSQRKIDATTPRLMLERNRCILCKRCVKGFRDEQGRSVFAISGRGNHSEINIDAQLGAGLSEADARRAMEMCPVGCILRKETGFSQAIGTRKFDRAPIGSDIEAAAKP